ncbi:MAG: PEP-CTERM sorting domain-containing protein [Geitlerinemataceae cyanobacterium]
MKFSNLTAALGAASLALAATSLPAHAAPWTYGFDAFNDGVTNGVAGDGGAFEFYGMAVTEDEDNIFLALNSNLSLSGYNSSGADDGHIGWGDLFLNFSGKDTATALADGDLFALHIAGTDSDSSAQVNGLYQVGSTDGVASSNSGFDTLAAAEARVDSYGYDYSVGDLDDSYFDKNVSHQNVMSSGTKVGDIAYLDAAALSAKGLDFGSQGAIGSETFGFSFSKADLNLPEEYADNDMIAWIFAECNNDGMGIMADVAVISDETPDPEDVPEPATALGLLAVAGGAMGLRRRRA